MKRSESAVAVVMALVTQSAVALVVPTPSPKDPHIQRVDGRNDVIRVVAAEGVSTTIELSDGELIKEFSLGDSKGWTKAKDGNRFVMKPAAPKADTNLTLYTDRGRHLFRIKVLPKDSREVAYWLTVVGNPAPPPPAQLSGPTPEQLAAQRRWEEKKAIARDFQQVRFQGRLNYDYWISGTDELQPVAAHDNGEFTYLTFSASKPLPAPFWVEADGSESIANFHMEDDGATMVLHRVSSRLLLRRGNLVAGITNRSPQRSAQPSPTGTASDKVRRVIPLEGVQ